MGQYHTPVCLDTAESIHAHALGEGLKLCEWGMGTCTVTTALALLLGPGGTWAGRRVAVVGDYAEPGDLPAGVPFADDPAAAYGVNEDSFSVKSLLGEAFGATFDGDKPWDALHFDKDRIAKAMLNTADEGYHVVNLDTGDYLDPEAFGCGRNLSAIATRSVGVMWALTVLLAVSNNRGGGDVCSDDPLIGSWGGHRIAIIDRPGEGTDQSEAIKAVLERAGEGPGDFGAPWEQGTLPPWLNARATP